MQLPNLEKAAELQLGGMYLNAAKCVCVVVSIGPEWCDLHELRPGGSVCSVVKTPAANRKAFEPVELQGPDPAQPLSRSDREILERQLAAAQARVAQLESQK